MNNEENIESIEKKDEPATIGTVLIGLVIGGLGVTLCYFTWTQPELLDSIFQSDSSGRGARKVKGFLGLLYNRVTGSLGGLIGAFLLYGTLLSVIELIKGPKKEES